PPPPPRRPPGRLKLGPNFSAAPKSSKTVWFRFRTRFLQATASPVDFLHQNVVRLRLHPSVAQSLLRAVVHRLPSPVQTWFDSWFPEWNLSSQLIFKKYKEGWDEEFEAEKRAYARVRSLQGVLVPQCFGEFRYDKVRALLLSDIGGANLAEPEGSLLEVSELRRMLSQTVTPLAEFQVLQDDVKLDNFHVVGDTVMAVDLERLHEWPMPDKLIKSDIKWIVDFLGQRYEDNQYCYWEDGLIAVEK
ncbi:hypothetical protein N658DRAFT_423642, partial [Parathielavia hyrcaniae]